MFISSGGGHFAQLRKLAMEIAPRNSVFVTETTVKKQQWPLDMKMLYLPHGGRENPFKFAFQFAANIAISVWRVFRYRPRVVVSTGAHTAVPTCYLAKLFGAKVIFIETLSRVSSPTLTGRMVYPIADDFYVQWETARKFYPNAKWVGRIY